MASFEQHCQDCIDQLGEPFPEVHKWLDAYFGCSHLPGYKHRRVRHHDKGIEEAERLFGRKGADAAVIHIIRDEGVVPCEADMRRRHIVRKMKLRIMAQ